MAKVKVFRPGKWEINHEALAPHYVGIEIEFSPPSTHSSVWRELLKHGIIMSTECRGQGDENRYFNMVTNATHNERRACCSGMHRYVHMLRHLLKINHVYLEGQVKALRKKSKDTYLTWSEFVQVLNHCGDNYQLEHDLNVWENKAKLRKTITGLTGIPHTSFGYPDGNWMLKSDPTCGLEIVSPPLKISTVGACDSITKVCRALDKAGGEATAACGLHVHVNLQWANDQDMRRVIMWYRMLEPFLSLPTSMSRLNGNTHSNPWMKQNSSSSLDTFIKSAMKSRARGSSVALNKDSLCEFTKAELGHLTGHSSGLSTCGMSKHGTIEFRLKEGTLDANEIVNWASLLERFVFAAVGTKPPVWPDYLPIEPTARSIRLFLKWLKLWPVEDALPQHYSKLGKWYVQNAKRSSYTWTKDKTIDFNELENGRIVHRSAPSAVIHTLYGKDGRVNDPHMLFSIAKVVSYELDPSRSGVKSELFPLAQLEFIDSYEDIGDNIEVLAAMGALFRIIKSSPNHFVDSYEECFTDTQRSAILNGGI